MQNKKARVLLAGSYGHGNLGDEAILAAIVTQLRARMPEVRLVVVAGDTQAIRQQFGVETVSWADWAAIAQAVEQSDIVIQGGGGIFFDYNGFHPWNLFEDGAPDLAHYSGFSMLAKIYAKPFMVYSVGVGPLLSDGGREMVKVAHSLAHQITVRDAESKLLLEEIGVEPTRVEITADPAFALQPVDEPRVREILTDEGVDLARPVIALTARPWDYAVSQSDWENSLADAIAKFASAKQAQILLIPFHKGYDEAPLLRIRDILTNNQTFILRSGYTPQEVAGVIGACDLLLGMRFHSILFAILTATPVVALVYNAKVRSLIQRVGHEEVCLDLTDLSQLKSLLASVWDKREELSADFTKVRDEMKALSERNADLACALLNAQGSDLSSDQAFRDLFAKAFYGRLQAVRVRDRVIAKQSGAEDLQEILKIMQQTEQMPLPSPVSEIPDSNSLMLLHEFLQRAIPESNDHLLMMYDMNSLNEGATVLTKAFADYGIPTIFVSEMNQAMTSANPFEPHEKIFQLPVTAMIASWDEVLDVTMPQECKRILMLRSADQNTFRLINHAQAMGWVTIYYPRQYQPQDGQDSEAERYIVSNVEYVIVGSKSLRNYMQSSGVQEVKIVAENAKDQVAEILALIAEPIHKSLVRIAIEGASHG